MKSIQAITTKYGGDFITSFNSTKARFSITVLLGSSIPENNITERI